MTKIWIFLFSLAMLPGSILSVEARDRDRDRRDRYEERRAPDTCKPMLTVRGDRAFSREGAVKEATKAWAIAAKTQYGLPYSDIQRGWTNPDAKVDNPNCFADPDRWAKKWECSYSMAPCIR